VLSRRRELSWLSTDYCNLDFEKLRSRYLISILLKHPHEIRLIPSLTTFGAAATLKTTQSVPPNQPTISVPRMANALDTPFAPSRPRFAFPHMNGFAKNSNMKSVPCVSRRHQKSGSGEVRHMARPKAQKQLLIAAPTPYHITGGRDIVVSQNGGGK
jgi:hypothetical protein